MSGKKLDAAIGAFTTASTTVAVAQELTRHALSMSATAQQAWVVEIDSDPPQVVASCVRGESSDSPHAGVPVSDSLGLRAVTAALAGENPASVEIPQTPSANRVVALAIRRNDPALALVITGLENSASREPLALLVEIASAVLERMSAERALTRHAEHIRALGERLLTLGTSSLERTFPADATTVGSPPDTEALTAREREILEIVASGASNAEIADQLTLSIETVKTHVKRILRKMNAANRSQLIAMFADNAGD